MEGLGGWESTSENLPRARTGAHPESRYTAKMRCPWCESDPLLTAYHDAEWGVPLRHDRGHYEFLVLEAAQAGLSWLTVLRKREGYRRRFAGFDAEAVARFGAADIEAMLTDPGIVRNRAKVEAAVGNAARVLALRESHGSLSDYLWGFVDGTPVDGRREKPSDIPAKTDLSDKVSKDLKARGFKFVGSTVIYAHLQAAGLVNDHLLSCPRHDAV
jgi:DNA-3-methyladenine glycosylase I